MGIVWMSGERSPLSAPFKRCWRGHGGVKDILWFILNGFPGTLLKEKRGMHVAIVYIQHSLTLIVGVLPHSQVYSHPILTHGPPPGLSWPTQAAFANVLPTAAARPNKLHAPLYKKEMEAQNLLSK